MLLDLDVARTDAQSSRKLSWSGNGCDVRVRQARDLHQRGIRHTSYDLQISDDLGVTAVCVERVDSPCAPDVSGKPDCMSMCQHSSFSVFELVYGVRLFDSETHTGCTCWRWCIAWNLDTLAERM